MRRTIYYYYLLLKWDLRNFHTSSIVLGYEDQFPWEKQGSCVSQGLVWIFDGILDWMDAPNNELKGRVEAGRNGGENMEISSVIHGDFARENGETMGRREICQYFEFIV